MEMSAVLYNACPDCHAAIALACCAGRDACGRTCDVGHWCPVQRRVRGLSQRR